MIGAWVLLGHSYFSEHWRNLKLRSAEMILQLRTFTALPERGSGFVFSHSGGSSRPSITSLSRDLMVSLAPVGTDTWCTDTYTGKTSTHIKNNIWVFRDLICAARHGPCLPELLYHLCDLPYTSYRCKCLVVLSFSPYGNFHLFKSLIIITKMLTHSRKTNTPKCVQKYIDSAT